MVAHLAVLALLSLLARLGPRLVLPYAMDSDAAYHLLAARRIREHGFRLPVRLRGLFFPGPYDYPPLFHFLLALAPPRFLHVVERFIGCAIDVLYVGLAYGFMTELLVTVHGLEPGLARSRALAVAAVLSVSPALLYIGRGPRTYGANPRVFAEPLFGVAMLFTSWWFRDGAWWTLLGAGAATAVLLLSSKFGTQVLAFFFPLLAALLGAPSLLLVPAAGFALALLAWRGHYLRVLKGHLGHLALFAQVASRRAPTASRASSSAIPSSTC
jgi:hypothetical protein